VYALWLAQLGCAVDLVDPVQKHVDQQLDTPLVPAVTLHPMLTPPLTRRRVVDLGYVSAAGCPAF